MATLQLMVAMSSAPHLRKYTFPSFTPPMLPHVRTCQRQRGLNSHDIRGLKGGYFDESCEVIRESSSSILRRACQTVLSAHHRSGSVPCISRLGHRILFLRACGLHKQNYPCATFDPKHPHRMFTRRLCRTFYAEKLLPAEADGIGGRDELYTAWHSSFADHPNYAPAHHSLQYSSQPQAPRPGPFPRSVGGKADRRTVPRQRGYGV